MVVGCIVLPIAFLSPSKKSVKALSLNNASYFMNNEERCVRLEYLSTNKTSFEEALQICFEKVTNVRLDSNI